MLSVQIGIPQRKIDNNPESRIDSKMSDSPILDRVGARLRKSFRSLRHLRKSTTPAMSSASLASMVRTQKHRSTSVFSVETLVNGRGGGGGGGEGGGGECEDEEKGRWSWENDRRLSLDSSTWGDGE